MKVVLVDNCDRMTVSDMLLKDGLTAEEAEKLANDYNDCRSNGTYWFAMAKPDDYELWNASCLY